VRHHCAGKAAPCAALVAPMLFLFAAIGAARVLAAEGNGLPQPPPLPELVRTKQQVFSIPFRLPPPQSPDAAAKRVLLGVSKDLGGTWEEAGEVDPGAGSFTYKAGDDGEYWFRIRAVDIKGRSRGGAGPDIRVLVDAAGPRLAARVWKGPDGEIICRYAGIDDSIRIDSLVFEYRGKGDQDWKKISAGAILSRESPAHMVGEEIWWAGEQVDAMTVRIAIADSSGNRTVRQFSLEPSDPQVDQTALAREIGAPPLPLQHPLRSDPVSAAPVRPLSTEPAAARISSPASGGWTAETGSAWSGETPEQPKAGQSVLVRRVGTGGLPPQAVGEGLDRAASTVGLEARKPLEYRGKPLQLVRSRRFAWDYEYEAERSDAVGVRVELWSTRDGGVTWQRVGVDEDATSPINVTLPAAGLHGFRLEVVSDLPDVGGGPAAGEMPDSWVGVDDEPPQVELVEAARAKSGEAAGVVIRYTARDQMLVPRSTRISYAPTADGPWATIAESLENQGEHRWQPQRSTPPKVFIRVEASDAAGNVGIATSAGPVLVAPARVVGKLGSVRELP
jgi:hypothetical protein